MPYARVIPSLLIHKGGLVKTVKFKNPKYVGDPINAIRIFNDKEVDELMVLDIDASKHGVGPDLSMLRRINREAFMPLSYGGGVRNVEDAKNVLSLGYEKIVVNNAVLGNSEIITQLAEECGSQSVVVCIDVKKDYLGHYRVYDHVTAKCTKIIPSHWAVDVERLGAGEIVVYSVDREGTFQGYSVELIHDVSSKVRVPVVALGGAGNIEDLKVAIKDGGATAVSAGSIFVFHGPHRAVLISYPMRSELETLNFN